MPVSDPLDGTSDATPTCDSWYICIYISLYTRQFSVTAKRGGWILWIPKYPEVLPNPCPSGIQLYNGTHPPQSQLLRRYDSIPRDISFIYVYIYRSSSPIPNSTHGTGIGLPPQILPPEIHHPRWTGRATMDLVPPHRREERSPQPHYWTARQRLRHAFRDSMVLHCFTLCFTCKKTQTNQKAKHHPDST